MKIDITDKLDFAKKPELRIKDVTVTVNDEATAVLKILPLAAEDTAKNIEEIVALLFSTEDIEKIKALGLSFKGYMSFVEQAISVATGGMGDEGEAPTRATT